MYLVEKLVGLIVGKLYRLFGGTDKQKAIKIMKITIAVVCTLLQSVIILVLGFSYNKPLLTIIFMVLFGLLRMGKDKAEHYETEMQCIIGTTVIFMIYLGTIIISDNFVIGVLASVVISLIFRKWNKK